MAKTKLAKKRRLARAKQHQAKTRTTPPYSPWGPGGAPAEAEATATILELQREYNDHMVVEGEVVEGEVVETVEQPTRAKCPHCGFSQKVRKDGTMSRHDLYAGSTATECSGTGQRWDAA